MTGIVRRFGSATVLLVLGLALAGCSDDDPAPPPETGGSSPTESPTSAVPVATPTLPAAATADPEGAEVFVRYFWDVFNYTYASGDTTLLRSISDKSCKFCASTADEVNDWVLDGSRVVGSTVFVSSAIAPPVKATAGLIVTALIQQDPGRVIAKDGQTLSSGRGLKNQRADILVRWLSGKWRVLGVSFNGPTPVES